MGEKADVSHEEATHIGALTEEEKVPKSHLNGSNYHTHTFGRSSKKN